MITEGPWKERKFIDLWSLVHFLSGFAVSGAFIFFDLNFYLSFILALILFIGIEFLEIILKVREHFSNRITDIFVNYAGYFLAQLYVFTLGNEMHWYIPSVVAAIALGLQRWGFLDSQKRKKNSKI